MTKIAVCFYGLVGGLSGSDGKGYPISPKIAHHYYQKHVFNKNDNIDVFVHSWSVNHEREIRNLYRPVACKFEDPKAFNAWRILPYQLLHLPGLRQTLRIVGYKFPQVLYQLAVRTQSRWYSNKQVLNLVAEYEAKEDITYDYVFVTRFDVAFFRDIVFLDYDNEKFYVHHRNYGPDFPTIFDWLPNKKPWDDAYGDLWYFSNSENMKKFGELYDELRKYSVRPPHAGTAHIYKITDKVEEIFYYGEDFYPVRFFLFGRPY